MSSRINSRLQSRRGSYGGEELRDRSKGGTGGAIEPDFLVQENEEDEVEGTGGAEDEEVDEGEMRKIVMGRVGGWVDWAVGWMDFRAEDEDEGDADEARLRDDEEGNLMPKKPETQHREPELDQRGVEVGESLPVGPPPPPAPQAGDGMWADTKWLVGVASKIVL